MRRTHTTWRTFLGAVLLAPALTACSFLVPPTPDAGDDGGPIDAGLTDAGLVDAGTDGGSDSGPDAGLTDGGPSDGGLGKDIFEPCDAAGDCREGSCTAVGQASVCTESCGVDDDCDGLGEQGTDARCVDDICLPFSVCETFGFDGPCAAFACVDGCGAATCEPNVDGGTCVCDDGYAFADGECTDIDECATDNGGCGDPAFTACINNIAAAPTCDDIDECATDNGGCGDPAHVACANNEAAAPTCSDIDECMTDNGGCGDVAHATCTNNDRAAPTCTDIDECATDNGGCGDATFTTCTNNDRVAPTCADIDECATNNGGCGDAVFTRCENQAGAAPVCVDIDECATNNGGCGPADRVTCADNQGAAPTCTDIDECATNNGGCGDATYITCTNEERAAPTCTDIDECAVDNGGCGPAPLVTCENQHSAEPVCTDVDECAVNNGGCGPAAFITCENQDIAPPVCTDINECATNNGGCGDATYTTCTNVRAAPPVCADIDECATDNGGCGDATFTRCENQVGAAPVCSDIDECATDNGGCGDSSAFTCTNQVGAAPLCERIRGTLDPAFGVDGVVHMDAAVMTEMRSVTAHDGGLVFGGWLGRGAASDAVLWRLNAAGAVDTTFGTDGALVLDGAGLGRVYDVTSAGGRLYAAGASSDDATMHPTVWALDAAGTPVESFGTAGMLRSPFVGRAFHVEGEMDSVFAGGAVSLGGLEYPLEGALDETGVGTFIYAPATSSAGDRYLSAAGGARGLWFGGFDESGLADQARTCVQPVGGLPTCTTHGALSVSGHASRITGLSPTAGGAWAAGVARGAADHVLLAHVLADGTLDAGVPPMLEDVGHDVTGDVHVLALPDGGAILAAGTESTLMLWRVDASGALDAGFATAGVMTADVGGGADARVEALVLLESGDVLIAGSVYALGVRGFAVRVAP